MIIERFDSGVAVHVIAMPTDEERQKLIEEGFTLMSKCKTQYEPYEIHEIWIK